MPDYDLVVVSSGFAGSTAALSFLETTDKAGEAGRVAVIEAGKKGAWPGGSRWTKPFLRLGGDNTLSGDRVGGEGQDGGGLRTPTTGAGSRRRCPARSSSWRTTASS